MKKIFFRKMLLLTSFFIVFGCGNNNNPDEKIIEAKSDLASNEISLTIEFKLNSNDKFNVYYSDEPNLDITGENVLSKYFFNNNEFQKLTFNFPKGEKPYKIRLDLGNNPNATQITIKDITLKYGDKSIDGNDGLFLKYWFANQSLQWDNTNYFYNIIPFENSKNPMLISNEELNNAILELYK